MPHAQQSEAIGVAHFSTIGVQPAEFVGLAAAAGFGAVGLRLFPAFAGAPAYEIPRGSRVAREVKARLDDLNVALYDIEFVVIDPAFEPRSLLPVLEDAAALGAQRLNACGDDTDSGRLQHNFAMLCKMAAEVGMAVDLENMGWRTVRTFGDSLALVEAAGAENAGVLVDALHFFRNGANVEELMAAPAKRIRSLQLCDVGGPAPTTNEARIAEARGGRLAPGAGELPLAAMLAAAPRDAFVSVEVPINADAPADLHLAALFQAAHRVKDTTGVRSR